jgi:uncharacterized membrane protein YdjX (TVP38/TMEM64 family)
LVGIVCLLVLGAMTLGWFFGFWGLSLPTLDILGSVAAVENLIQSWGPWGMLASVALMIVHSLVPFPAEILAIANGMLYGPVLGTVLTWIGGMCGALLAFGLARALGRPFVEKVLAAERLDRMDRWAQHHGGMTLLLARLIPVIAFNLLNYGAGLTSMSWWTFTWATAIGILPMCVVMATVGASIFDLPLWIWIALTAALALTWLLIKHLQGRSGDAR